MSHSAAEGVEAQQCKKVPTMLMIFFFFLVETVILIRLHKHESSVEFFKQAYNIFYNHNTTTKGYNLCSSSMRL